MKFSINFNPQDFFKIYDQYCLFMNPKNGFALYTKEEYDQMVAEMEYDGACYEADSDYTYERRMHTLTVEQNGLWG